MGQNTLSVVGMKPIGVVYLCIEGGAALRFFLSDHMKADEMMQKHQLLHEQSDSTVLKSTEHAAVVVSENVRV